MRKFSLFLAVAAISPVVACGDPTATIEGVAVVPSSVQMKFSKDKPGLLVVQKAIEESLTETEGLYLLCEPMQGPIEVKFDFADMPCLNEGKVYAWIEPAQPGACGPMSKWMHEPARVETWLASGEAIVFKGKGCKSGEANPRIELAPRAQP